uniref:von Willebrand factor C and EGF domains n=1 Tax=Latimeria chalumnae TaxID=7897 RepID=H3BF78_LATCH
SNCGEYGCDLSCNHGGCEQISRVCPLGFTMIETSNGVTCKDINECSTASCNGLCVNTEGGFVCECGAGMRLSPDKHSCVDIDECSANWSPCHQRCKNSIGSYKCSCGPGFYLHSNGRSCLDVNECHHIGESRYCQHSCHNTVGTFICSCRAGYQLKSDKVSCEDRIPAASKWAKLHWYANFVHGKGWMSALPNSSPQTVVTSPLGGPTSLAPSTAATLFSTPSTGAEFRVTSTVHPTISETHKTFPNPLTQPASSTSPLLSSLHCLYEGMLYENGSNWITSDCINCDCKDGTVLCQHMTCNTSCTHPVPLQGECCPSCDRCFYEGILINHESVFLPADDNCTVCICISGDLKCISPECLPVTCDKPILSDCCPHCPMECIFQGKTYPDGAEFANPGDICTTCTCQNGEVECSYNSCPVLECPREDWLLQPGECCFICSKTTVKAGCSVDDNGIEFPVGQIWSPGDPCEICICQADGSVVCKRTECLESCLNPVLIPGQCCPDCSAGCSYNGEIYQSNQSFASALDQCLTCICLSGSVACSPVECNVGCTYPFHSDGDCCPSCTDCNHEGRKVNNGQSFQPENNPCVQCTCQFGEVSCETVTCLTDCSHPYITPGECCPTC